MGLRRRQMAPRREACWCCDCDGREVAPATEKRHSDMPRAERAPQWAVQLWRAEYPAFAEACNRERLQAEQRLRCPFSRPM